MRLPEPGWRDSIWAPRGVIRWRWEDANPSGGRCGGASARPRQSRAPRGPRRPLVSRRLAGGGLRCARRRGRRLRSGFHPGERRFPSIARSAAFCGEGKEQEAQWPNPYESAATGATDSTGKPQQVGRRRQLWFLGTSGAAAGSLRARWRRGPRPLRRAARDCRSACRRSGRRTEGSASLRQSAWTPA